MSAKKRKITVDNFQEHVHELVGFKSKEEKENFEAVTLQLDFLNVIKEELDNRGITYTDLAKAVNVSKSYISQVFYANKPLSMKLFAKILRHLEMNVEVRLTGYGEKKSNKSKQDSFRKSIV